MRIHIIGVATKFMTGIALLARQAENDVTASDSCIDPPTRQTLEEIGVQLQEGFHKDNVAYKPDLVVIGNDVDSNNQEIVAIHRLAIPYLSGSEWLEKYVLNEEIIKKVATNAASAHKSQNHHIPDKSVTKHAPKIPLPNKPVTKHAPKIPLEPNTKLKRITR